MDPIEVAVLWFVAEDGELLIAQRSLNKRQDPGVWGPSMTGKREPGESMDETLVREVHEELGIEPSVYSPIHLFNNVFDHPDGKGRHFYIYAASFPKSLTSSIAVEVDEVAGVRWASIEQLESMMDVENDTLVPSARMVWPTTFEALRKTTFSS